MISTELKTFLTKKLQESENYIKRKNRKVKIVKILYYSSTISVIIISSILAVTTATTILPIAVTIILPIISAILTAISVQFNFKTQSKKLQAELQKLNKIKTKLDYVVNCNGDLTEKIYDDIISEFTV